MRAARAVSALALALTLAVVASVRAGAEPIRLLSYNIRVDFDGMSWPARREGVEAALTSAPYDIIAIQEASELMIADYQAMLPDFHYVVGERSDGHRGDQDWYEFVPIFYRPDRFALERAGSFWVGEDPDRPGDTLNDSKWHGRVFTWALLREHDSDARFAIGNVHIHGQQAERAVALIDERLRTMFDDAAIVLAGDFNVTPESAAYDRLTGPGGLGYVDAMHMAAERSGPEVTVIGAGEAVPSGADAMKTGGDARRIDYVFVKGPLAVARYAVKKDAIRPGVFPSDHFPVAVELMRRPQTDAGADR